MVFSAVSDLGGGDSTKHLPRIHTYTSSYYAPLNFTANLQIPLLPKNAHQFDGVANQRERITVWTSVYATNGYKVNEIKTMTILTLLLLSP
jgi:hypothetical protein